MNWRGAKPPVMSPDPSTGPATSNKNYGTADWKGTDSNVLDTNPEQKQPGRPNLPTGKG